MLFGTLTTAVHWPFAEYTPASFSLIPILIICGLGGCGLLSQLSKSQSFRLGEASTIAPIMYTMIIWSALFDYLLWDKVPGWNVITGGFIIIASNLFILYRENKKRSAIDTIEQAEPSISTK